MVRLRRRHFLQLAGSSLAAATLNTLVQQGDRMHRAWAQPTGRKLALLVGINQYEGRISNLSGCVNDVRLQYELLVHRYGFDPQDIVIVSEPSLELPAKQIITTPTRQAILDTFKTHLIEQAQPGDVVVFHYSGHGTYIQDPDPIDYGNNSFLGMNNFENFEGQNGVLVPRDALSKKQEGRVNVIMGSTLFLLSLALKTDNVTLVLDSCYSGGGVRGNLVYRATLDDEPLLPIQAELDFQEALRAELGLTRDRVQELRRQGIAKGIAMTSARSRQTAAETTIANFRAGIFSYLLTRYLWQTSTDQPVSDAFLNLARITSSAANALGGEQDPIYFVQPGTPFATQPPYLLSPAVPSADAVVRRLQPDGVVEFWLGGVTPRGLKQANSMFDVLDAEGNPMGQLRQTQRNGLLGYGEPIDGLKVTPGMFLREQIRGIPTDFVLRIGLHESLGNDAEPARQVLSGYDRVVVVNADGQTETDYLFGRFDETAQQELSVRGDRLNAEIEPGSFGLFTNALDPLPSTFASRYETIGPATERLVSRLRLLLARQALKTILNPEASSLQVRVDVASDQRGVVLSVQGRTRQNGASIASMQIGEEMLLTVTNEEARSLYVAVIAIERDGDMYVYHPSHWNAAELEAELSPGESVTIPKQDDVFYLPISGPPGFFEVLVIASTEQLRDTLRSLNRLADRAVGRGQLLTLTNNDESARGPQDSALSIVDTILGDLDRTSAAPAMREQRNVNVSQLAALSITIEARE